MPCCSAGGEARHGDQFLDDLGFVDPMIFAQTLA
jgi:hypothetical protein